MLLVQKQRCYLSNPIQRRSVVEYGSSQKKEFYYILENLDKEGESHNVKAILLKDFNRSDALVYGLRMKGLITFEWKKRNIVSVPNQIIMSSIKISPKILNYKPPEKGEAYKLLKSEYCKHISDIDIESIETVSELDFHNLNQAEIDQKLTIIKENADKEILRDDKNVILDRFELYLDAVIYNKYLKGIKEQNYKIKIKEKIDIAGKLIPIINNTLKKYLPIYVSGIINRFFIPKFVTQEDLREIRLNIWKRKLEED